ncbi:MAG: metallophosphoesterase [Candidatus Aenigmatarchaeota archaeon]
MRVSIIGDAHCGFAWGEERGDDSIAALEEAVRKSRDADLILIVGDLFDGRLPKPEVFAAVAKILAQAQAFPNKAHLLDPGAKEINPSALRGVPVLALHGNHDRRSRHLINPVQALEHAGLLIYLHGTSLLFDCDGTRLGIHGMSSVPERYAKEALMTWNPKPATNSLNLLMLHQSIEPYIYSPLEPPSLKLDDLPDAFNLLANGHMHWHDKRGLRGNMFLNTGSISPTTLHRHESEQKKCFWTWDGNSIETVPLESQRKIFLEEFQLSADLKDRMNLRLENIAEQNLDPKPIVSAKVVGTLPVGSSPPNLSELQAVWAPRMVLQLTKSLANAGFETNVELLHALRENRLTPEESGLHLLMENLKQAKCAIKADEIFDLLIEGNVDMIFDVLTGVQRRLI